jgi:hypothetical protein
MLFDKHDICLVTYPIEEEAVMLVLEMDTRRLVISIPCLTGFLVLETAVCVLSRPYP